jgi:hypothetical protein
MDASLAQPYRSLIITPLTYFQPSATCVCYNGSAALAHVSRGSAGSRNGTVKAAAIVERLLKACTKSSFANRIEPELHFRSLYDWLGLAQPNPSLPSGTDARRP